MRDWAETGLPRALQARLERAEARWAVLAAHLADLDAQQQAVAMAAPADSALGRLIRLKGVAATSASTLLDEGLVWRAFRNRREVGGLLGFTPTPFESGERRRNKASVARGIREVTEVTEWCFALCPLWPLW